jgi:uncharacterized membrane protein
LVFLFAVLVLIISVVVSFPLLLDREVGVAELFSRNR